MVQEDGRRYDEFKKQPSSNGQRSMRLARILIRQGKAEQGVTESLLLGRWAWKRSDYETADSRAVV